MLKRMGEIDAEPARYYRDLPLRVFHWILVLSVISSYVSAEAGVEWIDWHMHTGRIILFLIIFRICWGFVGTETSRFSIYFSRSTCIRKSSRSGQKKVLYPLYRAVPVFTLLGILLVQTVSGLFAIDDETDTGGPLSGLVTSSASETMTACHQVLFNLVMALITVHVVAIASYAVFRRENLVTPMITGYSTVTALNKSGHKSGFGNLFLSLSVAALISIVAGNEILLDRIFG